MGKFCKLCGHEKIFTEGVFYDEETGSSKCPSAQVPKLTKEQAFKIKRIVETCFTSKKLIDEEAAFYQAINDMTE